MRYLLEISQEEKDMLQRVVSRECRRARHDGGGAALNAAESVVKQLGGELDGPLNRKERKKRKISDERRAQMAEHMRRIRVNGAQKKAVETDGYSTITHNV